MKLSDMFLPSSYREFFAMIDQCQSEVEIITSNGFHLNLKSKLCQYVVLTSILMNKEVKECELIAHSVEDLERILLYMFESQNI